MTTPQMKPTPVLMADARRMARRDDVPIDIAGLIAVMADRLAELDPDHNLHHRTAETRENFFVTVREVQPEVFEVALETRRGVSGTSERLVLTEFAADSAAFTGEHALDAAIELADKIVSFP